MPKITKQQKEACDTAQKALKGNPGIVSVGVGYRYRNGKRTDEICLVVGVKKKLPAEQVPAGQLVPESVNGVATDVIEYGELKPHQTTLSLTQRRRPSPPGYSVGHPCFSSDTRVLTQNGLKFFYNLSNDDEIATLNGEGVLEYHRPNKLLEFPYKGQMMRFESKTVDLLVTPNHKLYYRNRHRKDKAFRLEEAAKVMASHSFGAVEFKRDAKWNCAAAPNVFRIPPQTKQRQCYEEALNYNGKLTDFIETRDVDYRTVTRWKKEGQRPTVMYSKQEFPYDDWLRFLGWYLSEGSSNHGTISISEKSGKYHGEIIGLCQRMGLTSCVTKANGINISHLELAMYLKRFGTAREKYVPAEVKALRPDKLHLILESLMRGDGHFEKGRYRHFKSTSWRLANDVFEIALKCGFGVTLRTETMKAHSFGERLISGGTVYRVGFSHVKKTPRLNRPPEAVNYSGKVYCVDVPNHVVFVERNGKTCWSGNSVTAGTLGAWVKRGTGDEHYILSNNHVIANSNDTTLGVLIRQPGRADGGTDDDRIARLTEYVRIRFDNEQNGNGGKKSSSAFAWKAWKWPANFLARMMGCPYQLVVARPNLVDQPHPNLVDAAIAQVILESNVDFDIPEIGEIQGIADLQLGDRVQKTGRTTEHTTGMVEVIGAESVVNYGSGKGNATFNDQLVIRADSGDFSAGGDSGSAIVTEDNVLGGLLFAGGDGVTIANKISNVVSLLGIRL